MCLKAYMKKMLAYKCVVIVSMHRCKDCKEFTVHTQRRRFHLSLDRFRPVLNCMELSLLMDSQEMKKACTLLFSSSVCQNVCVRISGVLPPGAL